MVAHICNLSTCEAKAGGSKESTSSSMTIQRVPDSKQTKSNNNSILKKNQTAGMKQLSGKSTCLACART